MSGVTDKSAVCGSAGYVVGSNDAFVRIRLFKKRYKDNGKGRISGQDHRKRKDHQVWKERGHAEGC